MWPFRPRIEADAVHALLRALDQLDPLLGNEFAYGDAKTKVRELIRKRPQSAVAALSDHNRSTHAIVLTAMATDLEEDLASGRENIYRGVLSGQGQFKRTLFHKVVDALTSEGECT